MSMSMQVNPYDERIDEAPAFWLMDSLCVLLASGDQTAGHYCLLWELCSQGSGPGPHTHEQDEQVYVLEGELTLRAGNQLLVASAGSFLFIPRGTVHSFRVDSQTATMLNSYTPAGYERQLPQLGVPAKTRTLPPPGLPLAVTDPRHTLKILAQAGVHLVDEPDALRPSQEWGDALRPSQEWGDPSQVRDLQGSPLGK
jgi:mannose-6-phosphate isomerase-like protein (cupin superfamily)